jgi:LPXTG-motif cell wall-anchored protein
MTLSVKEDAVDGYTSVVKTLVLSGDEAEAFASDTYYEITILNIKDEEMPEPAIEETTAAPDPTEEEPTTPETSATEPETTAPETSATEPETTSPETSATEPETTVPETTGSSSGGGPSPKESTEPRETTQSDDNPTEAPTESATEPVTESATVPETLPETQPSVSESVPEVTQPEKPIHPELPEIPVTPEGEPDIPEGTEVEVYDLDDTSDPVYTGPYEEKSLNLPPGDYEIVVIDDEGVPLAAGLFTIDEDGIPQSMGLPKTGDTSIPFVLLALLLAGSAAGMAVLTTRIRHMDE